MNGNTKLGDKDFNWIGGMEFYTERTERERFSTSFRRKLNQTQDRHYDIQAFSSFFQGELNLHKLFTPTIGLRYDIFAGNYRNKDAGQVPFKGSLKGLSHFSPKLGFRSTLVDNFDFRANVSNGFSLPSGDYSEEKYSNHTLKPIELWQYEVGFSYNDDKNLHIDLAGFILNSSNELVQNPNKPDEFMSAGKTKRMGVEADAKIIVTEGLLLKGNFTYTYTQIKEGENKGKALTQLSPIMFNLGAMYTTPIGLGADVLYRNVADYYTTGDNSAKGGGYNVVNMRVFYNFDKLFSTKGNVFFAVNNLFNTYYAETIFGTNLYSASPTRNFTLGVNYSF